MAVNFRGQDSVNVQNFMLRKGKVAKRKKSMEKMHPLIGCINSVKSTHECVLSMNKDLLDLLVFGQRDSTYKKINTKFRSIFSFNRLRNHLIHR